MVGDGSYLMLSAEMATAVQEGLEITVVLVDNHGFQCIGDLPAARASDPFNRFRLRDPATGTLTGDQLPVDFAANAASLGAHVLRADGIAGLREALAQARPAGRPVVIVCEVDGSVGVPGYESWWDVPVAEVSGSPSVRAARAAYEVDIGRERRFR